MRKTYTYVFIPETGMANIETQINRNESVRIQHWLLYHRTQTHTHTSFAMINVCVDKKRRASEFDNNDIFSLLEINDKLDIPINIYI